MDCRKAQEEILEAIESDRPAQIDAHVAACPACAAFAAHQKALDAKLSAALPPPELSPAFRANLRKRIREETVHAWPEWLPDALHFASCGVATLLCALLLPFDASSIFGAGAAVTLMTYVVLTAFRIFFEDAEDSVR